ncbi:MAG: monovalent cation/H(+) antiporter subunit G [Pseudomonadota bacterium]|nr:monovalent cation/H(+) antiporter subunit G [Pseudomonadota bacterium]
MTLLLDTLSWGLLIMGGGFCVLSGIGLFRMPDVFTRSHAAGMTDAVGATLILTGLLLQTPDWTVAVRLVLIIGFLVLTSPTASHALAQAALTDGLRPQLGQGARTR